LGLFSPFGFHPYGGAVFEERSPQGLGAFQDFFHHYRFLDRKKYEEDDICLHRFRDDLLDQERVELFI
jgi:hypothetical protein